MPEEKTRELNMAGMWWVPENYDDRKMGTLRWIPLRGCLLELLDHTPEFYWGTSPQVICGWTTDKIPVTLLGCSHVHGWIRAHIGKHIGFRNNIWVDIALIGCLYEKGSDVPLEHLCASYAGLDKYVTQRYFEIGENQELRAGPTSGPITLELPIFDTANTSIGNVGLIVDAILESDIRLRHRLLISFDGPSQYRKYHNHLKLVHEILPAFLGTMMGHHSFLTDLGSTIDNTAVKIFEGRDDAVIWDGNSRFRDRLVLGNSRTLELWPVIIPAWIKNYDFVEKLCHAYIRIMSETKDGFFEVNNLVHIYFGLEAYCKAKCNSGNSSLKCALDYILPRIRERFGHADLFSRALQTIDKGCISHARQVLVHSNEGDPDFSLIYRQLVLITRCILLMEMEYPLDNVEEDTQHWSLWASLLL